MTRSARVTLGVLALALLAAGPAYGAGRPHPTTPVHVTRDDPNPTRTYSAPFLLVDPEDPLTIVGSYIEFRSGRCGLIRSSDGGATWSRAATAPALDSFPFCLTPNSNVFQAPLAWGRNHTLYYALAGWDIQDGSTQLGNISVQLARSTGLGDTWDTTVVRNARGREGADLENNRPIGGVAVDTESAKQDIVYVTWQSRASAQRTGADQVPDRPVVAVSYDGGKTFADQVVLSDGVFTDAVRTQALRTVTTLPPPASATLMPPVSVAPAGSKAATPDSPDNFGGRNPGVVVDGKGNAYVLWHSVTSNLAPAPAMGEFLSKSTDRGKTWTTTQFAPFDPRNGLATTRMVWSPKGGPDGTLHVVQQGTEYPELGSYQTIYYRRSVDGGKTFSERRPLADDDPAQFRGQYAPNIAVAPNGRLDVVWWDTRDDPGIHGNDVYQTYSTDNGATWSRNLRVTDRTVDRNYGVWSGNFDLSSPPGLASTDAYVAVSWDDTRLTDAEGAERGWVGAGSQDIFTADLQYTPLAEGAPSGTYALAGAAGLVIAGAALLFVAAPGRRRRVDRHRRSHGRSASDSHRADAPAPPLVPRGQRPAGRGGVMRLR